MEVKKKNEQHGFIENLVAANRAAGVVEDVVDLLAGYARLCIKLGLPVEFYNSPPLDEIKSKYPLVNKFIRGNQHLEQSGLEFLSRYAELLRSQKLPILFNIEQLASYLSISSEKLQLIASNTDNYYKSFSIPKASGGLRRIDEPLPALKEIQTKLLRGILENIALHPAATAFRRKKSIAHNAKPHVNKKVVVRLDLKDYFPSISIVRVQAVFVNLGYPKNIAQTLAKLTTYKNKLPMGSPASPYLSNVIAGRLDRRFEKLCEKCGFSYTRYADDLIFSSGSNKVKSYIPIFLSIIKNEGFDINEKKLKVMQSGSKQKVTGVVANVKINIDRQHYKKLRATLHNCCQGKVLEQAGLWGADNESSFKNQMIGHINFVRMLNVDKADKLQISFNKIQWSA